jgi:hypothetical protein
MILVNRAYSEMAPESAEDGEFSDTGLIAENSEYGFRELVDAMREHSQCSTSHPTGDPADWLSTGFYTADYGTGTEREETLHYSCDNPPRNAKYWRLAMIAAGIAKR